MNDPYRDLAQRLDALPNGYPSTEDGVELRLLAYLFTPEEAQLAAQLRLTQETPAQISARTGLPLTDIQPMLKGMARRGLITAGRIIDGLGYGLMPFVVGIYEMQVNRIDAKLAALFEDYYHRAFSSMVAVKPFVHRVVPVNETIRNDMAIQPYESATHIIDNARAWGVSDCLCRKQKALIGEPCKHPVDVCMILSQVPNAFDNKPFTRALTRQEALDTLKRAAEAGLVHSVSNSMEGVWYICNCCTCSCGILRGMSEQGIANVIARSDYVNTVDTALCLACGDCVPMCQFNALELGEFIEIDRQRCVGCGVCVLACPEEALHLVLRPAEEIKQPPRTEYEWLEMRAADRGLDLNNVL